MTVEEGLNLYYNDLADRRDHYSKVAAISNKTLKDMALLIGVCASGLILDRRNLMPAIFEITMVVAASVSSINASVKIRSISQEIRLCVDEWLRRHNGTLH